MVLISSPPRLVHFMTRSSLSTEGNVKFKMLEMQPWDTLAFLSEHEYGSLTSPQSNMNNEMEKGFLEIF
jgi:hypothetical protein